MKSDTVFECAYCGKNYLTKKAIDHHLHICPEAHTVYWCPICDKLHRTRSKLGREHFQAYAKTFTQKNTKESTK